MLFDEAPALLIQTCTQNFNTNPDKACLRRSQIALTNLSTARAHILSKHKSHLTQLTRNLSALHSTHALAVQSHNAASHAADMNRLDTDKFRIAKEASELEIETERLDKDILSTRRGLEEAEAIEAAGGVVANSEAGGVASDETVLKLKVYRMMGIDVEPDAETGLYTRAVVRNREKGDVRVVNVDPKFSRWFYADYFWKTM